MELKAFVEELHEAIGLAMHKMVAETGYGASAAWGSGADYRRIVTTEKSWRLLGQRVTFNADSQLPVKATPESIALHRSLIDKYQGEISAAEKTLAGGSHLKVDSDTIREHVGWLKAEIGKTQVSLFDAEAKLRPWAALGLTGEADSLLPVQPNVDSLRMHKALMARYEQDFAAAQKALWDMSKGAFSTLSSIEVRDRKNWLQEEINRTQASLLNAQAVLSKDENLVVRRDRDQRQFDRMKTDYNAACMELSTLKDNGVHRAPAQVDALERQISDLEDSMGKLKASVELADAVIAGTYIPLR